MIDCDDTFELYSMMPGAFPADFDIVEYMNMKGKKMTTYDSNTGDIVPSDTLPVSLDQEVALGAFSSLVNSFGQDARNLMSHRLAMLGLDSVNSSAMLTKYKSGPVDSIINHINEVIEIQGAIIDYHDAYLSKPVNGRSEVSEGYFYMRLCTTIMREIKVPVGDLILRFKRPLLIQTSAREIIKYFMAKMESDCWFDFSEPITCIFTGSQSTGYSVSTFTADEAATIQEAIQQSIEE